MEKWQMVVVDVVAAIAVVQVLSNVLYLNTPGFWTGFSLLAWNMLVIGADTSFIGMYYGLKAYIGATKMLGRNWYWAVFEAAAIIIVFQVAMNMVYFTYPSLIVGIFNSATWNMLVLSASTSFLAMYYGIRAYIAVVRAARTGKLFDSDLIKSIFSGNPKLGNEVVSGGRDMLKEYVKDIDEVVISFDKTGAKLQIKKRKKK